MDTHTLLHRLRLRVPGIARVLSAATLMAAASGCLIYPDSDERVDDDIVITRYAAKADFESYQTFAINPTLNVAEASADGEIEIEPADPAVSDKVIARIVKHMESRGYEQVENKDDADLGLTATAIKGIVVGSAGFWGGYYGWYWGYPGWGYYYPYEVYYAYQTGTLVVDMIDLEKARQEWPRPPGGGDENDDMADGGADQPPQGALGIVWGMAGYRAVIDESAGVRLDNALAAIDQGFAQSPYLKAE